MTEPLHSEDKVCEDCEHWDQLHCRNKDSDHYGHSVAAFHPECNAFVTAEPSSNYHLCPKCKSEFVLEKGALCKDCAGEFDTPVGDPV